MDIIQIDPNSLKRYAKNARTHPREQIDQIKKSIKEFGFTNPILINPKKEIIAGHGRHMAALELELKQVPAIILKGLSPKQIKALRLADNQIAIRSGWNIELLAHELKELEGDYDLGELGFGRRDLYSLPGFEPAGTMAGNMVALYQEPPFSILNARTGRWRERKAEWNAMGIHSHMGRKENLLEFSDVSSKSDKDTSIFDPVLCELMIGWFSRPKDLILDPFAGGSVRGLVAKFMDRSYTGFEISKAQIAANEKQAKLAGQKPIWIEGDAREMKKKFSAKIAPAHMILSCPPYHDLEKYSEDPRDLSNMAYPDFLKAYREVIAQAYDLLNDNCFAVWVVGEIRDPEGHYRDFVGDTVQAFKDAGFKYYNEIILVTACGSLALRTGKLMRGARKIGKTHQNVLVFLKGDAKKATARLGKVDFARPEADDLEDE